MEPISGPGAPTKIELQLGEMIGTVKMTVQAIENLRATVEKLAERAAYRSEVDALRLEMNERLAAHRSDCESDDRKIKDDVASLKTKVDGIFRWSMMAMGGLAVLTFILRSPDIIVRILGGG